MSDLDRLFKTFGGKQEEYKNFAAEQELEQAKEDWALLSAISQVTLPKRQAQAPTNAKQEFAMFAKPLPVPERKVPNSMQATLQPQQVKAEPTKPEITKPEIPKLVEPVMTEHSLNALFTKAEPEPVAPLATEVQPPQAQSDALSSVFARIAHTPEQVSPSPIKKTLKALFK